MVNSLKELCITRVTTVIFLHQGTPGCLDIHRTHVTANNTNNSKVVFFFVANLKIVYYNNY